MVKLTFFLSGGSQEGADLVAPDVSEFGLSKCSFQQRVTLLFFFYLIWLFKECSDRAQILAVTPENFLLWF